MNNIPESFESIKKVLQKCIEKEITQDGLLSNVETFIPVYHNKSVVEEPVVWMTQHPSYAERQADISQTMDVTTPFEFTCAVYHPDLDEAENASQYLALNVVLAITKNFLQVQKELLGRRIIKRIDLGTYYPVGQVEIVGKSESVLATSAVLNIVHTINWMMCCKKK